MLDRLRGRLRPSGARRMEARMEALERRVASLESLIEGLQDAVYRESVRHDERTAGYGIRWPAESVRFPRRPERKIHRPAAAGGRFHP